MAERSPQRTDPQDAGGRITTASGLTILRSRALRACGCQSASESEHLLAISYPVQVMPQAQHLVCVGESGPRCSSI